MRGDGNGFSIITPALAAGARVVPHAFSGIGALYLKFSFEFRE